MARGGRLLRTAEPDDLKRIRGIGVVLEKKLNALGITNYAQIAAWTETEVADLGRRLDIGDQIAREKWVEQAQVLASSGETDFSRRFDRGDFSNGNDRG